MLRLSSPYLSLISESILQPQDGVLCIEYVCLPWKLIFPKIDNNDQGIKCSPMLLDCLKTLLILKCVPQDFVVIAIIYFIWNIFRFFLLLTLDSTNVIFRALEISYQIFIFLGLHWTSLRYWHDCYHRSSMQNDWTSPL